MHDMTAANLADRERVARSEEEASRKAAEAHLERTRLLDLINQRLASTFDFDRALRGIADDLISTVADLSSFDLVESGLQRNVAARHVSPEKQASFLDLRQRYSVRTGASIGAGAVMASGSSQLLPSLNSQILEEFAFDGEHLGLLREMDLGSMIVVPLKLRNQTIGAMTLARSSNRTAFSESDHKMAQDIADRISLFGENYRLHRELEIASKAKDEFLATLSHELRTPLTSILGWAQIAADDPGNMETAFAALRSIGESARAQKHLIVRIEDDGMGIPAEELPFIFDNFRQSAEARQHGGLGLGLAIVRELVELHGGEVAASSGGAGRGSTFELWLPLQNPAEDSAADVLKSQAGRPLAEV